MDEMDEYRERIERRHEERRMKNDRRQARIEPKTSPPFDWGLVLELLFLIGISIALIKLN